MLDTLRIIYYPDPRLKQVSAPVRVFDQALKDLAVRMFELMREHRGVGLAAPQVGRNIRLFVMNATGDPNDDRVYVNPVLTAGADSADGDEGCLSLPGITTQVLRAQEMQIAAQNLDGQSFEETQSGLPARVWQHEVDHLNGTMIIDRMGPAARMGCRRLLKELEEKYHRNQSTR